MDEKPDTPRQRAGYRDLGCVQQRYNAPAELLRCPGGKYGIEIVRDGEQPAYDVVGRQPIGFDQRAQQLVGGREDFRRIVPGYRGGAAYPVEPD
jgi:hypothetical protein